MKKDFLKLPAEELAEKYSLVLESVDHTRWQATMYLPIFFVQRLVVAAVLVFLRGAPWLQLLSTSSITFISLLYCYSVRPFEDHKSNVTLLITEVGPFACSLLFFAIYLDFYPEVFGQMIVYFISSIMIVTLCWEIGHALCAVMRECRERIKKRKSEFRPNESLSTTKELEKTEIELDHYMGHGSEDIGLDKEEKDSELEAAAEEAPSETLKEDVICRRKTNICEEETKTRVTRFTQ